jgi:2-aminoadipate transaminase
MTTSGFAYSDCFVPDLPAPAPRFAGFAPFNFVGGHNDPEGIPRQALAEAAARVILREGAKLAIYHLGHGPLGYPGLRDFVADKLTRRRGLRCTAEDVLITSGSGQGIELVTRLLLMPGDTVLLEEHCYTGAITRFRACGATVVGMALDEDGIRIDALEAQLGDLAARGITPKCLYTIPTIQNPTGSVLPLERRRALLALAKRFSMPVFEDECYADLIWSGGAPPALYALAPDQVIHIGSFSKSLAPALRVGYAVADASVLARLVACKTDGGTGALDQMVIAEYFSGNFDAHIARLCALLEDKLDTMLDEIDRQFGTSMQVFRPKGGIFVWMKLPDGVDVRKLVQPAAAAGLAFNPGPDWACDADAAASYLRLCFALPSKAAIREGVATLARVCFEATGVPAFGNNSRRTA